MGKIQESLKANLAEIKAALPEEVHADLDAQIDAAEDEAPLSEAEVKKAIQSELIANPDVPKDSRVKLCEEGVEAPQCAAIPSEEEQKAAAEAAAKKAAEEKELQDKKLRENGENGSYRDGAWSHHGMGKQSSSASRKPAESRLLHLKGKKISRAGNRSDTRERAENQPPGRVFTEGNL